MFPALLLLPFLVSTQSQAAAPGAPAPRFSGAGTISASAPSDGWTPIPSLPFTITEPGAYYLPGNLTGVSGQDGITVNDSGGVTIDLNGFELVGVPGSLDGIVIRFNAHPTLRVRGGVVRNWGGDGVDVSNTIQPGGEVSDVVATDNGGGGILASSNFLVQNCVATFNGTIGISVQLDCTVQDCQANQNGTSGIFAFLNCVVRDCVASMNAGDGILANTGVVIVANSCTQNGVSSGIGAGIRVIGNANTIDGNTLINNDRGVDVDASGNLIVRNRARANSILNYDIAAGNRNAQVLVPGANFVSTDPWANFQY